MGFAEASTRSVLASGWQQVSIEQRGPDGTEVLALVIFHVCPICRAVVPVPDEEHPFDAEHSGWHIKQAQDFDVINTVMAQLTESGVLPDGDPA